MTFSEQDLSHILAALRLSADRHRNQRRKNIESTPYINHPIDVADLLWRIGNVRDTTVIIAALLHDVIEDTKTAPVEIECLFGNTVLSVVLELTDDKSLPKSERKRLQIEHSPYLSAAAKQISLADKICNVLDTVLSPPKDWSIERRIDYLDWTEQVVAGLRGCNPPLEQYYDEVLLDSRKKIF